MAPLNQIPLLARLVGIPEFPFGAGERALRRRPPRSSRAVLKSLLKILGLLLGTALFVYVLAKVRVGFFSAKVFVFALAAFGSAAAALRTAVRAWVYNLLLSKEGEREVEVRPFQGGFTLIEPWGVREDYTRVLSLLSASRSQSGIQLRFLATKAGGGGTSLLDIDGGETVMRRIASELKLPIEQRLAAERPLGAPRLAVPGDVAAFLRAVETIANDTHVENYREAPRDDAYLMRLAEDPSLPEEERVAARLALAQRGIKVRVAVETPLLRIAGEAGALSEHELTARLTKDLTRSE